MSAETINGTAPTPAPAADAAAPAAPANPAPSTSTDVPTTSAEASSSKPQPLPTKHKKLSGYDFYRAIGSPKYVVAPMVDQSELAWRLLSKSPLPPDVAGPPEWIEAPLPDGPAGPSQPRKYARYAGGAHLTYTPMIHARVFSESRQNSRGGDPQFNITCNEEGNRKTLAGIEGGDRPLFVQVSHQLAGSKFPLTLDGWMSVILTLQFCANDPDVLLSAAKKVQNRCDAVDINFGCPQGIAKRGKYGSFLMEDWDLIARLISTLHVNLTVPVTAKFRIFPEVEKTVRYAQMMEAAGAQILTCHGRLREQKGPATGLADWDQIKAVKEAVSVPVFANGNILYADDALRCMEYTGCDGVMSAEGNLNNPALFADPKSPNAYVAATALARRYLDIVAKLDTPTAGSAIKAHLFHLLKPMLDEHEDLRVIFGKQGVDDKVAYYRAALDEVEKRFPPEPVTMPATPLEENGYRKLPRYIAQPYIRAQPISSEIGGVEEFEPGATPAGSPGPIGGRVHINTPCVGEKCGGNAAARCPTTACLLHCREIRAIAKGMDPAEAKKKALSGGLVGMGCEAHEAKQAERSERKQERHERYQERQRQKRQRRRSRSRERERERRRSDAAEEAAMNAAPAELTPAEPVANGTANGTTNGTTA